jgi:hypothetical protein
MSPARPGLGAKECLAPHPVPESKITVGATHTTHSQTARDGNPAAKGKQPPRHTDASQHRPHPDRQAQPQPLTLEAPSGMPIGAFRQDLPMDLDSLDQEVARRASSWANAGATWEVTHGRATPKPAAWIRVETSDAMGELTLWVSGEADMAWVRPIPDGDIQQEHYEITGELGLRGCLDDFERHLGIRT